jgi:ribose/xylose/arabinose/galactoside ABC-type transport system permease subunit
MTSTQAKGLVHATSTRAASLLMRQGALVALVLLVLFGALRYNGFLSHFNIMRLLSYNAMFGLVALGMAFVIITGGIDLSVGSVAAFASVVAAVMSPHGLLVGVLVPVLAGTLLGLFNGVAIARFGMPFFIATLAMLLGARGLALIVSGNRTVPVSYTSDFTAIGQADILGIPVPVIILFVAYVIGALVLGHTRFGRHVLAIGGNEEAARLLGLPVDRIKIVVYTLSGALAGFAGVLLAAQFGAGQPLEGLGWELSAIAAVVVGGTLLTGGRGSVSTTLVGVLLLGLIFNILNFESGKGIIFISAYWQTIIRGLFLLAVVLLQKRLLTAVRQR